MRKRKMHKQKFDTVVLSNYQEYSHLLSVCRRQKNTHKLFVKHGGIVERFTLAGRQQLGRLQTNHANDICILNPIISRRHGFFETIDEYTFYTATQTTNGISINGHFINPGERILLKDGDELIIPSQSLQEIYESVTIICAFSPHRIQLWDSVMSSQYDSLTLLPNRQLFTEWFNTEFLYYYERFDYYLFLLDIDKFKNINDKYGHDAGDEALKALSKILLETVENINHTGRWGGDEFVGILRGDAPNVVQALDSMNRKLSSIPIRQLFFVSLSIGICKIEADTHPVTLERLLKNADQALYSAKSAGRGRVEIFQSSKVIK